MNAAIVIVIIFLLFSFIVIITDRWLVCCLYKRRRRVHSVAPRRVSLFMVWHLSPRHVDPSSSAKVSPGTNAAVVSRKVWNRGRSGATEPLVVKEHKLLPRRFRGTFGSKKRTPAFWTAGQPYIGAIWRKKNGNRSAASRGGGMYAAGPFYLLSTTKKITRAQRGLRDGGVQCE
jgi:hypothetical protein